MDLTILNVVTEDEDRALILLSYLPDEGYETSVLTLINGRTSLSYSEVTITLVNLKLGRKNKKCSSSETSANVFIARGSHANRRRENQHRSNWKSIVDNRQLKKKSICLL